MDLFALWDLLHATRTGRTTLLIITLLMTLLTTHYVASMAHGQLRRNGSSNFLEHTFGAGYKLIATMTAGVIDLREAATVKRHMPHAGGGGGAAGADTEDEREYVPPLSDNVGLLGFRVVKAR